MKKKLPISTETMESLAEEIESIDRQLEHLNLSDPVELDLDKKLRYRMKVIAKAIQGHRWALTKINLKNTSGFYQ